MRCKASIALTVVCMLGSPSVDFAASRDDQARHHRNWTIDKRAGSTTRHPQADPPFTFACTTEGGYRVVCDW